MRSNGRPVWRWAVELLAIYTQARDHATPHLNAHTLLTYISLPRLVWFLGSYELLHGQSLAIACHPPPLLDR